MKKTVKKRFDLQVNEANKTISSGFELDKNIVAVKGLLLSSDRDELLYFRGSQKIEINREEIFPENYESKLLMSGINVSPGSRYYELGSINSGNKNVKVEFKDSDDGRTVFTPYRVSLYLECEMEEIG